MSDAPAKPAPAMPLFFKRIVGVNPALHNGLRLDRSGGFAFSAHAQSVPIGLGEFEAASQHYPLLFTTGPTPVAVALLGLSEGVNLFVQPDGKWSADTYVPAYIRAFPFIFVEDEKTKTLFVGMEPDADSLRPESGAPLFEDGKPTPALNDAIQFCQAFRDNLAAASAFARALDAQGLLEDEEATINYTAGGGTRIRGFKILKPERLDKISDETFLDWRRRGWIAPIYAHLHSSARWGRLIEMSAPRAPVPH